MIQFRRRRAVVTLRSGRTVVGTVALSWPWALRLRSAQVADPGGQPAPADGVLVVPRGSVDFVQYVV